MKSKSKQACIRDTRFVLKVRQTTNVTYVSIEVPTKSRISLNPKPPERSLRSSSVFHYQIPMKERTIQTFEVHHNLGDSQTTLVRLRDESQSVTNTRRVSMKCFA
jgi:hypothetical protein